MAWTDKEVVDQCLEFQTIADNSERFEDRKERSLRGDDYYTGIQWSAEDIAQLTKEGRYAITVNHILPVVNNLSGMERDNRRDIKSMARKGGYEVVADVLTALCKHTLDLCNGPYITSECFTSGVRAVRSYLKLEIQKDKDPINGQLVVRKRPCLSVMEDPTCLAYDWNDTKSGAKWVIDTEWMDQDYIRVNYPDARRELEAAADKVVSKWSLSNIVNSFFGGSSDSDNDDMGVVFDYDIYGNYKFKVSETWWKEWESRTVLVDMRNYEVRYLNPAKKVDREMIRMVKEISTIPEYQGIYEIIEKHACPVLHVGRRVGDIFLDHIEDPYSGVTDFPIIPFSPFWHEGYEFGVIDNLIGPQNELNKRRVNVLNIIQRYANAGWIVNKLAEGYGKILRTFGGSPGMVIELDKCGGSATQIQSGIIPPQQTLADISEVDIEKISGVSGNARGYEQEKGESGVLYESRVRQGQQTTRIIFDNFSYTNQIMAQTMIDMIRHTNVYSKEEIIQIVDQNDLLDQTLMKESMDELMQQYPPPQMSGPSFASPMANAMFPPEQVSAMTQQKQQQEAMQQEMAMQQYLAQLEPMARQMAIDKLYELLRSWHTGRYGIIVTDSPQSPTMQTALFAKLDMIAKNYAGIIPPQAMAKVLIQTSGLPVGIRDELMEAIQMPVMAPQQQGQPQQKQGAKNG